MPLSRSLPLSSRASGAAAAAFVSVAGLFGLAAAGTGGSQSGPDPNAVTGAQHWFDRKSPEIRRDAACCLPFLESARRWHASAMPKYRAHDVDGANADIKKRTEALAVFRDCVNGVIHARNLLAHSPKVMALWRGLLHDISACWKNEPHFTEPPMAPCGSSPATYDRTLKRLNINVQALDTARRDASAPGDGGLASDPFLAAWLGHEVGHAVEQGRGQETAKSLAGELEADRLGGQGLRCLVQRGRLSAAAASSAMSTYARATADAGKDDFFGQVWEAGQPYPHGTYDQILAAFKKGFGAQ
jgi:hypothetical protein